MLHFRSLIFLALTAMTVAACGTTAEPTDSTTTSTAAPLSTTTSTTTAAPLSTTTTTAVVTTTSLAPSTTTTPPEGTGSATVFFSVGVGDDCSLVQGFEREIPATGAPILLAFEALVGGPNATEVGEGAGSFFSPATTGSVSSIDLTDGLLTVGFVDFRNDLNNASTSCGSASLLASLNATAFEFAEVDRVQYTILGDCEAFYNWLQSDCQEHARDE